MNFERGQDPLTALDIGRERKLKKGDKFTLFVPAFKTNPARTEEAIASEDEVVSVRFRVTKLRNPGFGQDKRESFEVRRVRWTIPDVAMGGAIFQKDRWVFTTEP